MLGWLENLAQPKTLQRGDTIVEVLIAIGIAAFAIGVTYVVAQHSLSQSVTSREHSEALNTMEDQVAALKLRFQSSPSALAFNNQFGALANNHFCLDDSAAAPSDPLWAPILNNGPGGPPSETATLAATTDFPAGPYAPQCRVRKTGDGVSYYIDTQTADSGAANSPTVFQVFVRWARAGGGQVNQVSIFYQPNGGGSTGL